MTFANREDAGVRLGNYLVAQGVKPDMVMGLPRGGVVLAAVVARIMQVPLEVMVVRKIGHPYFREFAVGAIGENGTVVLDQEALERTHVSPESLEEVVREEKVRLEEYRKKFHLHPLPEVVGRQVVVVDDGLATGSTMDAAVRVLKSMGASPVIVAVPVASQSGVARLERVADRVMAILIDPDFDAVGRYYQRFDQTDDAEVVKLLTDAARTIPSST